MSSESGSMIDETFCPSPISSVTKAAIGSRMQPYEHAINEETMAKPVWRALPNHGDVDMSEPIAMGSVILTHPDTPAFPDMFSKHHVFTAGTSLARIVARADKGPLNDAYFQQDGMMDKLKKGIRVSTPNDKGISLKNHWDHRLSTDKAEWDCALGGSGAHVGVYKKMTNTEMGSQQEYYLLTKSSAPHVSNDIYDWLSSLDKDNEGLERSTSVSMKDLASASAHTTFAVHAGMRNRQRILYEASKLLGVVVASRSDGSAFLSRNDRKAGVRKPRVAQLVIDNPTHILRYFPRTTPDSTGTVVYYNCCTPSDISQMGVIVSRPVALGPEIHCAKRSSGNTFTGWRIPETYHAYPVDTGRAIESRKLVNDAKKGRPRPNIAWNGDATWNDQLVPGYYNLMDEKKRELMKRLGRTHDMEVVPLHPVIVVLKPMSGRSAVINFDEL